MNDGEKVVPFPGEHGGGGGDGTLDPPLSQRVSRLEQDVKELKADVKAARLDLAEIKGRLGAMPTTIQLVAIILATWGGDVALVFALIRTFQP